MSTHNAQESLSPEELAEHEEQQARRLRRYAVRVFQGALITWLYVLILAHLAPDYSGAWLPLGMVLSFALTVTASWAADVIDPEGASR